MSLKARTTTDSSRIPAAGIPVELGTSQAVGITVDNYSNRWLTIGTDGMWVPPFAIGWANNFYGSSASSIQVKVGAPPGAAQPITVVNGAVVIAIYDNMVIPNPGAPFTPVSGQFTELSIKLNVPLIFATSTTSIPTFGGVTGAAFFLDALSLSYSPQDTGALSANSAQIEVFVAPGSFFVNLLITPNMPTVVIPLFGLEARAGGIAGNIRLDQQAFGAAAVDVVLGISYHVN